MKVLMVEPGKSPYETEIEGGLESLQAAVGGDIQATYPFDDLVGLICNDEARRDVSVREQLDNARKQAAQTEPKAPDKRPREPERS